MTDEPPKKHSYTDNWRNEIEDFDSIYLIRSARLYVVWIDKDGDIEWVTTDEYDKKGAQNQKTHNAIKSEAAVLECAPCNGLTNEQKRQFKRLVGEAHAYNFDDDYQTAQRMLNEARTYLRMRSEEVSRFWYLSSSALMAALMIVLGFAIWIWRLPISLALTPNFIWISLAAVAGSCGALLSVIWRSGQLKFDSSAGQALHYAEGISRILAGALSGVLVALAVKSGFVLAPLTQSGKSTLVVILAAFVAGAGERLATSIISTFDSAHPTSAKKISHNGDSSHE